MTRFFALAYLPSYDNAPDVHAPESILPDGRVLCEYDSGACFEAYENRLDAERSAREANGSAYHIDAGRYSVAAVPAGVRCWNRRTGRIEPAASHDGPRVYRVDNRLDSRNARLRPWLSGSVVALVYICDADGTPAYEFIGPRVGEMIERAREHMADARAEYGPAAFVTRPVYRLRNDSRR